MMRGKIYWFFLLCGSFVCSLSLLAAAQETQREEAAADHVDAINNPHFSLMNAVARVQHDLAHQGYATFENTLSCPLSKEDLETLTSIFNRVGIPYQEIEGDVHNNAQEFVILLCFSRSPSSSVGARDEYIVKGVSVSCNNITNDDINKVVSIVRQIHNLLGDEDLGQVFTVNLTYYDEFRKLAEAFEAKAASSKEPTFKMLKLDELPWHQDKFGDYSIDFLGLFVLDAVGIGSHFLQLGLLHQNFLVENEVSAASARADARPKIVANILGQQGAGYFVDQSRVFDSSMIVHRRTALLTYFSNAPLSKNMMESDPEFFKTTAHDYPSWRNNCCASDYVRPSRKVLIVRIKKDSEI